MSVLDDLVSSTRKAVARRQAEVPVEQLDEEAGTRGGAESRRPFSEALARPGLSLIAEFKRSAPSAGEIRPEADVADVAAAYERGGAAALSVLTEEERFGGSLDDLRAAREACDLPILRKDFTVDAYQLHEAAAAGADAILLIVAALDGAALADLHARARALDLDCLVEVHDEDDLEGALEIDCDVVGINNRDLGDLSVDLDTTAELIKKVPAGKTVVSESGISGREQLEELESMGVDAVLIGEALMRAPDPEAAVKELLATL